MNLEAVYRQVVEEQARRSLLQFTLYTHPSYSAGWFHSEIAGKLETFLDDVIHQRSPRLMIFAPPRSGKTELVSRRFPAWALGKHPDLSFIATSYSSDLSSRNNRDVQRVMDEEKYQSIFPETKLNAANIRTVAQGTWLRNSDIFEVVGKRGVYRSAGVCSGITGMGASVGVIDDPVKDALEAESETYRERVWEWYTSTFYTRLAPGGGVLLIMCMTGDTPVLMADGTERRLSDIRVGDEIATYDDGRIATSTVRNWINQGPDSVFAIKTRSGRTVRANERHPFLVRRNGALEWVRLRDLRVSDRMMCAGALGSGRSAPSTDAIAPQSAKGCATGTTTRTDGTEGSVLLPVTMSHTGPRTFGTDTGSSQSTTTRSSRSKAASAPCADSHPQSRTLAQEPDSTSASTTITTPDKSVGCCATTATSPSGERERLPSLPPLPSTYAVTEDEIVSITPDGREDVFDIEVDRTANFIANGCVASNTRWHEDDLAGRLLNAQNKDGGDKWEVISYPAIAERDEPHRKEGEPLHPERYSLAMLEKIRQAVGSRVWISLYQQRPAALEGSILRRDYWRYYKPPVEGDPKALAKALGVRSIVQAWDTGFKDKTQNDPSVCLTLGIADSRYYVLDLWRAKVEYPELKRAAIAQHAKWIPHAVLVEDAASGQSLIQELRRDTRIPVLPVRPDRDKVARANAISPQLEAGLVHLPEASAWVSDFVDECASFPNGQHDDQVDVLSMAVTYAVQSANGLGVLDFYRREVQKKLQGAAR